MSKFNLISDNPFWSHLKKANDLHITSRQVYMELTALLKKKGVAFKDIKRYLMNEAKRAGLYRKDYWDEKSKEMIYRPIAKGLRDIAWYRTLVNYLNWLRDNYSDYGVEKGRKAKSSPAKGKNFKIVRKNSEGEVVSETTVTGGNRNDLVEANSAPNTSVNNPDNTSEGLSGGNPSPSTNQTTNASEGSSSDSSNPSDDRTDSGNIVRPVAESLGLTQVQIQQIIMQNTHELADMAARLGVGEEYGWFADAMNEAIGEEIF